MSDIKFYRVKYGNQYVCQYTVNGELKRILCANVLFAVSFAAGDVTDKEAWLARIQKMETTGIQKMERTARKLRIVPVRVTTKKKPLLHDGYWAIDQLARGVPVGNASTTWKDVFIQLDADNRPRRYVGGGSEGSLWDPFKEIKDKTIKAWIRYEPTN